MRAYKISYAASVRQVSSEKFEQWEPIVVRVVQCHDAENDVVRTESVALEWQGITRWSEAKALSDAIYKMQQLTTIHKGG
jgi:hypothetical protein